MEGTAELFTGFAERIAREKGTRQEMMREGDYIEDGLIHCGKCKGKRPVSYTHLDVYKRQGVQRTRAEMHLLQE